MSHFQFSGLRLRLQGSQSLWKSGETLKMSFHFSSQENSGNFFLGGGGEIMENSGNLTVGQKGKVFSSLGSKLCPLTNWLLLS